MNDIALIIVTAFINIVITGIVSNFIFLRYQKRVEESFAKSYLEYQTKFVRNQGKQVEALETLCRDFGYFGNSFIEALNAYTDYFIRGDMEFGKDLWNKIDFHACNINLDECKNGFTKARIYFSNDIVQFVYERLNTANNLLCITILALGSKKEKDHSFLDYFERIDYVAKSYGIELGEAVRNEPSLAGFIDALSNLLAIETAKVESVYKLVANVQLEPPSYI